jgi:hypothetical protein
MADLIPSLSVACVVREARSGSKYVSVGRKQSVINFAYLESVGGRYCARAKANWASLSYGFPLQLFFAVVNVDVTGPATIALDAAPVVMKVTKEGKLRRTVA